MNRTVRGAGALALAAALLCGLPAAAAAGGPYDLEIRQLTPGIYVLVRPDPVRQPVEPNALVIVNDEDVVVVDPGGSPLSAENAIRLIRGVTGKPVTVLINTHWHGDHVLGNQVYRKEFPGVRIVAHVNTWRDVTGTPMAYVPRQEKLLEETLRDWEEQIAQGSLSERRQAFLPDLRLMLAESRRTVVTPPDLTFTEELVLHRGDRAIHVKHLGRGNTEGDAIVWLPAERILASGDLVVAPIPYGFGSFPGEWIETLDRLAAYDFEILVPGHGEIQRDRSHIRLVQELLREVRRQAAAAVENGLDLEATVEAMDLSAYEERIAAGDEMRGRLFKAWWISPITRSAWLEARGEPIQQGAADETG